MSEAKHTPGPFVIRNDGDKYGDSRVYSHDGRELADCTGGLRDGVTFDEMHGNVRLFHAAPELLEALRAIRRDCLEVLEGREPLTMDLIHGIAHGKLRAAIAKAEGRS